MLHAARNGYGRPKIHLDTSWRPIEDVRHDSHAVVLPLSTLLRSLMNLPKALESLMCPRPNLKP